MASLLKYTTHLLRHTVKKCPQRIKDTPPGVFCSFRTDRDVRGTKQERCFCASKNSRPEVYTDVHFWTVYFKRLTERRISTATDGGGSTQKRCFCAAKTSPPANVHGGTFTGKIYLLSRAKWMPETSSCGTPSGKEISVAFIESAIA